MKTPEYIYELVDATDAERYYPLGIEFDLVALIQAAEQHDPSCWQEEHGDDEMAIAEIRAKPPGLLGHDYRVVWRCKWVRDEVGEDVWPVPWVHGTIETGTWENPLTLLP